MDDLTTMILAAITVLAVSYACISLIDSAMSNIDTLRQNKKRRKAVRK